MQCLWAASNVTWIAWGLLLGCFACKRNVMAWSHSWKNSSAVWNSAGGLVLKHPQLFRNTRRAMGVEHSQSLWLLGLRTTMFERSWKHPDSTLLQKTSANFLPKKKHSLNLQKLDAFGHVIFLKVIRIRQYGPLYFQLEQWVQGQTLWCLSFFSVFVFILFEMYFPCVVFPFLSVQKLETWAALPPQGPALCGVYCPCPYATHRSPENKLFSRLLYGQDAVISKREQWVLKARREAFQ
jgi:hypothetical protein